MGKTPKKATPGGDERNLYIRRLKATTNVSSKVSDTSSTVKQRESENPNRVKPIGVQKRLPGPVGKVFKSKLRSPAKTKTHGILKNPTRFQPTTSKDDKKHITVTSKDQHTSIPVPTMQADSEEAAVQLKVSITKKDTKETVISQQTEDARTKDETETTHTTTNGKPMVELTETENSTPREENKKTEVENGKKIIENPLSEGNESNPRDNGNESSETIKNDNETENSSSEFDDIALKLEDEEPPSKTTDGNEDSQKCSKSLNDNTKTIDNGESTESQKMSENSVDVVESTTSEASDSGNVTQSEKNTNERQKDIENDDSFVSYDSSIMLKDIQIKLNDCLKDNSKLFDVTNPDESCNADSEKRHDMSFGKTLRNISGRSTINRLRYVTVREQRFSPNSSLFVNTSRASMDPEDPASCKLTRYPTDLSDSLICNGSPADRKRKIVSDAIESAKKLKTTATEGGLLNTSIEMLKSIRRPVQVSTPNTKGYNFQSERYGEKSFGDDKLTVDTDVEPKKWCVVM